MHTSASDVELNPEQTAAVTHGSGPLLILAGAGSGKTRVLTHRIAHLVTERGIDPGAVLAITFTNKAARELKERLTGLLCEERCQSMWVGTFHAVCARILRIEHLAAGLPRNFAIADAADSTAICRDLISRKNLSCRPESAASAISRAKDDLVTPDGYSSRAVGAWEQMVAEVYRGYQKRLEVAGLVDFGDLIARTVRMFSEQPTVLGKYAGRFQHVLVDEYQDTNHAQYVLAGLLAGTHRNLVAVGDDDQSIYGWRGADLRNILDFERDFPDVSIVKLERNYRSTAAILEVANRVIQKNRGRRPKQLRPVRGSGVPVALYVARDQHDEARFVADEIRSLRSGDGKGPGCAVLYRSNVQSRSFEEAFNRRGIAYRMIGGVRFLERREVKDLLAYLRVLDCPTDDVSLVRVANVPRRGIGDRTIAQWREQADHDGMSMYRYLMTANEGKGALGRLGALADVLRDLEIRAEGPVAEALGAVIERTGFIDRLEAKDEREWRERRDYVIELVNLASEFDRNRPGEGLTEFLVDMTLMTDVDAYDEREEPVSLMTIHAAKGLEFDVVFSVGLDENVFPHYLSVAEGDRLEEERRLCYVAFTRARDRLYLVRARERTHQGRRLLCEESRFLADIPRELLVPAGDPASRELPRIEIRRQRRRQPDPAAEPGDAGFSAGDRVQHPTFGQGMVVSVSGADEQEMAAVAFPEGGVRKFLVKYARMKRVRD